MRKSWWLGYSPMILFLTLCYIFKIQYKVKAMPCFPANPPPQSLGWRRAALAVVLKAQGNVGVMGLSCWGNTSKSKWNCVSLLGMILV